MCQNDIWESLGGDVIFSCQWFAVHIQLFFPQLTAVIINTYSVYPFGRNIMIFDPTWMPCLVWMPKCLSLLFRLKEHNLSHSVCVCVCVCVFFFQQSSVTDEKNDDRSVTTTFGVNRPTISCFFDSKLNMPVFSLYLK